MIKINDRNEFGPGFAVYISCFNGAIRELSSRFSPRFSASTIRKFVGTTSAPRSAMCGLVVSHVVNSVKALAYD